MRRYNRAHSGMGRLVTVMKDHQFAVRERLSDKIRHRLGQQAWAIATRDAKAADHSRSSARTR
jgi:hypothetical protein